MTPRSLLLALALAISALVPTAKPKAWNSIFLFLFLSCNATWLDGDAEEEEGANNAEGIHSHLMAMLSVFLALFSSVLLVHLHLLPLPASDTPRFRLFLPAATRCSLCKLSWLALYRRCTPSTEQVIEGTCVDGQHRLARSYSLSYNCQHYGKSLQTLPASHFQSGHN